MEINIWFLHQIFLYIFLFFFFWKKCYILEKIFTDGIFFFFSKNEF